MFKLPRYSLAHLLFEAALLAVAFGFFRLLVTGEMSLARAFCVFPLALCLGSFCGGWFHDFTAGALFGLVLGCFLAYAVLLPAGA
jgi:hypothetical protein